MKFETLNIEKAEELIGKTIFWQVESAKENCNYHGVDTIISVDADDKNPIKTNKIVGDDLSYTFKEEKDLFYSDNDRFITFFEVDKEDALLNFCLKYGFTYKGDFAIASPTIKKSIVKNNSNFSFEIVKERVSFDTVINFTKITKK